MHLTARSSGWRFQIRIPRSLEPCFGSVPVRLNLGTLPKRPALRVARLLAGHTERLFRAVEMGTALTDISRDELVEQLQEMLVNTLAYAEAGMANLRKQRDLAVKTVTLRLQTERYRDQMEMRDKLNLLGGAIDSLAKTTENLPKGPRDDIAAQLAALSSQVQQLLAGGPDRPMLLDELPRWIELRAGHAQEKKTKPTRTVFAISSSMLATSRSTGIGFLIFRASPMFWPGPQPTCRRNALSIA